MNPDIQGDVSSKCDKTVPDDPDRELVDGLKITDPEAFASFDIKFRRWIIGGGRKLGLNDADCDDLVQEVMLKLFENIQMFNPSRGAKFKSWLFTVVRNCAVNMLRKQRRAIVHSSDEIESGSLEFRAAASNPDDPFSSLVRSGTARQVRHAVQLIRSHEIRDAVERCLLDGDSYKDVAEKQGVPANTVGTRIYRGRNELLKILRGIFPPEELQF